MLNDTSTIDISSFYKVIKKCSLEELESLLKQLPNKDTVKMALHLCFSISLKYDTKISRHLLINKGIDIHYRNEFGKTFLIQMIMNEYNLRAVDFLLSNGATFDNEYLRLAYQNDETLLTYDLDSLGCDKAGNTIYHYALIKGNTKYFINLLNKQPNGVSTKNHSGRTLLHLTAIMGNIELCKIILLRCPHLLDDQDHFGYSAIMLAVNYKHNEYVQYLLSIGSNITFRLKNGKNILHDAIIHSEKSIILKIIKIRPELLNQQEEEYKNTPLMTWFDKLNYKKYQKKQDIVDTYVLNNIIDVLNEILKCSVDLLLVSYQGKNILHKAAYLGHIEIFKLILQSSPHLLESKDYNNFTPFTDAIVEGHIDLVKYLLNKFNQMLEVSKYPDMSPMHYAAFAGDTNMARLLSSYGISSHREDSHGNTPLMIAVISGKYDFVKYLIEEEEESLDEYTHNSQGDTPLHLAACQGYKDIVELIVQHNPEMMLYKNKRGFIPLIIAAINEQEEVFDYFLARGLSDQIIATIITILEQIRMPSIHIVKKLMGIVKTKMNMHICLKIAIINDDIDEIKQYYSHLKDLKSIRYSCNNNSYNPFTFSVLVGAPKIVNHWLVDFPTIVQSTDEKGNSPILVAAANGRIKILNKLLEYGANILDTNHYGNTCLHEAAFNGELNMIIHLLKCDKISVTAQNKYGNTPLYSALLKKDFEVTFCLIIWEAGADLKSANKIITNFINYYSHRLLHSKSDYEKKNLPTIIENAKITQCLIKEYMMTLLPLIITLFMHKTNNRFLSLPRDVRLIIVKNVATNIMSNIKNIYLAIKDDADFICSFRSSEILSNIERNMIKAKNQKTYIPLHIRVQNNIGQTFFASPTNQQLYKPKAQQTEKYIPPHLRKR